MRGNSGWDHYPWGGVTTQKRRTEGTPEKGQVQATGARKSAEGLPPEGGEEKLQEGEGTRQQKLDLRVKPHAKEKGQVKRGSQRTWGGGEKSPNPNFQTKVDPNSTNSGKATKVKTTEHGLAIPQATKKKNGGRHRLRRVVLL